jgi:hypothetical protein
MTTSSDLIQAALESQVDTLARWLVFFTGLVVLGLMLEYGGGAGKAVGAKWTSKKLFLNLWVPIWSVLGGLLIVGGVAGDLYAEFLASRAENNLRQLSDSANAVLKEKADQADQKTETLRQENIVLQTELLRLRKGANEKAETLRKENLATEQDLIATKKELEEERTKRIALEESERPRKLRMISQSKGFDVALLRPFSGTPFIMEFVDNSEARQKAEELSRALRQAGWDRKRIALTGDASATFLSGVYVTPYINPDAICCIEHHLPPLDDLGWGWAGDAADAAIEYLLSNKWFAVQAGTPNDIPPGSVKIIVGIKPEPYFNPHESVELAQEQHAARKNTKKENIEKYFQKEKN